MRCGATKQSATNQQATSMTMKPDTCLPSTKGSGRHAKTSFINVMQSHSSSTRKTLHFQVHLQERSLNVLLDSFRLAALLRLTLKTRGDEMTPSEKLRLIARGFEYEKVTNAQAKSAVPALLEAADALESLQKDAARFRWIRNNPQWIGYDSDFRPDEIEKQVDAAMSRGVMK